MVILEILFMNLMYLERYWKFLGLFPPHFLKLCEQSLSSSATLGSEKFLDELRFIFCSLLFSHCLLLSAHCLLLDKASVTSISQRSKAFKNSQNIKNQKKKLAKKSESVSIKFKHRFMSFSLKQH